MPGTKKLIALKPNILPHRHTPVTRTADDIMAYEAILNIAAGSLTAPRIRCNRLSPDAKHVGTTGYREFLRSSKHHVLKPHREAATGLRLDRIGAITTRRPQSLC